MSGLILFVVAVFGFVLVNAIEGLTRDIKTKADYYSVNERLKKLEEGVRNED